MTWKWWPVKSVREKLQAQIDEVDAWLRVYARAVDPADRDQSWRDTVDAALGRRSALVAQRDLGFMITDRRRVRG